MMHIHRIQLYQCSQCGVLSSPVNGVQAGYCGIRRGLGDPPARVCGGLVELRGWTEVTIPNGPATSETT